MKENSPPGLFGWAKVGEKGAGASYAGSRGCHAGPHCQGWSYRDVISGNRRVLLDKDIFLFFKNALVKNIMFYKMLIIRKTHALFCLDFHNEISQSSKFKSYNRTSGSCYLMTLGRSTISLQGKHFFLDSHTSTLF